MGGKTARRSLRNAFKASPTAKGLGQFIDEATRLGALRAKLIDPSTVATAEWVRWRCQYGCGGYGRGLVCPPYSPTPAQTRKTLEEYKRAILFESPRGRTKQIAVELERTVFLAGYYKAFGMGAGGCYLCQRCALGRGCRHPRQARPSMEACGIDVFATVRANGFSIDVVRTHGDPQHYFGLVLVE